jgi:hypothetical protein
MLAPIIDNCQQFGQAGGGDTCQTMIVRAGIPADEFLRINPAFENMAGCEANIVFGTWYCLQAGPTLAPWEPPILQQPEPPAPTEAPVILPAAPSVCSFGSCWKSFVDVSTGSDAAVTQAVSASCTVLFAQPCFFDQLGFPDGVREGCPNCQAMASACLCFLEGRFHTHTGGLEYAHDWLIRARSSPRTQEVDAGSVTASTY